MDNKRAAQRRVWISTNLRIWNGGGNAIETFYIFYSIIKRPKIRPLLLCKYLKFLSLYTMNPIFVGALKYMDANDNPLQYKYPVQNEKGENRIYAGYITIWEDRMDMSTIYGSGFLMPNQAVRRQKTIPPPAASRRLTPCRAAPKRGVRPVRRCSGRSGHRNTGAGHPARRYN